MFSNVCVCVCAVKSEKLMSLLSAKKKQNKKLFEQELA